MTMLPLRGVAAPAEARALSVACFTVSGTADPGLLPRVLELIAKLGRVPLRCHADLDGAEETGILTIDLAVADLTAEQRSLIAARAGNLLGVRRVLVSDRQTA